MGARPRDLGGGFAHGKPIPDERRCVAVCKGGKRAGDVCGHWTSKDSSGEYTQFCAGHLGIPQRRWVELSEERKLDKLLALDAAKAEEAKARDKLEQNRQEVETKAAIEREALRKRQLEREREQILRLEEERARNHPPDWPKPGPGWTWTKKRVERAKAQHTDAQGGFEWAIVPTLQVLRQEVDALLVDGMRQRDQIMGAGRHLSGRELVLRLNRKRRRAQADQDRLVQRW